MLLITIFAGAAALLLGTEASAVPRQAIADPHITNFRIWSAEGCAQEGNLGVWTITKSQTNVCQPTFNAPGDDVKSIRLNSLVDGCEVFVYPTPGCEGAAQKVNVQTCEGINVEDGAQKLLSFKVVCA
ncbi:hypothetical protein CSHISOI_09654 [Colletotrichum shisoi]|uniref:Uncharacterized protein n=1 Tax=Colletotrichum shisoi TaxID=2078593 RepID=A0A5Q4BG67_9PEZI|nr:hypothetical protein CSHISOI_09654 [Colletotrichum shisoi]